MIGEETFLNHILKFHEYDLLHKSNLIPDLLSLETAKSLSESTQISENECACPNLSTCDVNIPKMMGYSNNVEDLQEKMLKNLKLWLSDNELQMHDLAFRICQYSSPNIDESNGDTVNCSSAGVPDETVLYSSRKYMVLILSTNHVCDLKYLVFALVIDDLASQEQIKNFYHILDQTLTKDNVKWCARLQADNLELIKEPSQHITSFKCPDSSKIYASKCKTPTPCFNIHNSYSFNIGCGMASDGLCRNRQRQENGANRRQIIDNKLSGYKLDYFKSNIRLRRQWEHCIIGNLALQISDVYRMLFPEVFVLQNLFIDPQCSIYSTNRGKTCFSGASVNHRSIKHFHTDSNDLKGKKPFTYDVSTLGGRGG